MTVPLWLRKVYQAHPFAQLPEDEEPERCPDCGEILEHYRNNGDGPCMSPDCLGARADWAATFFEDR